MAIWSCNCPQNWLLNAQRCRSDCLERIFTSQMQMTNNNKSNQSKLSHQKITFELKRCWNVLLETIVTSGSFSKLSSPSPDFLVWWKGGFFLVWWKGGNFALMMERWEIPTGKLDCVGNQIWPTVSFHFDHLSVFQNGLHLPQHQPIGWKMKDLVFSSDLTFYFSLSTFHISPLLVSSCYSITCL